MRRDDFTVGIAGRTVVIAHQYSIGPTGGAAQGLILDDRRVIEQCRLPTMVLETIIRLGPDTGYLIVDFTHAVLRAPARAISLILCAL